MTADERLEALLNRAGQTISDLPKPSIVIYAYPKDMRRNIYDTAATWHGRLNYGSCDLEDYILHLTDVIDRMETALENVCGERDYLLKTQSFDCEDCVNFDSEDCPEMQTDPALRCDSTTAIWKGVSEYWRVDDETD